MLLHTILSLAVLSHAAAQCVYTPTECQCSEGQAGKMCLRYSSGGPGTYQCEAYTCGSGYVCDCGGSEMCAVSDCTGARDVYRPTGSSPSSVGEIVGCDLASQVTCVTPAAISPSPSPVPAAIGEACSATIPCASGAECDCQNMCRKSVSIEVQGLGDNNLSPWMCGVEFGSPTNFYTARGTWTFSGPCSDIYFYSTNDAGTSGVTVAVREQAASTWYTTQIDGSSLSGTYVVNATNTDFFTDPAYDFSAWKAVVPHRFLPNRAEYALLNTDYGAQVWTSEEADAVSVLGGGPTWYGSTWYKASLPFC